MVTFKEDLIRRVEFLNGIILTTRNKLKDCEIDKTIYAHKHGNGYQYYCSGADGIEYIKAKNIDSVKRTVQMEYERKVLKAAENEYKKLVSLLKVYSNNVLEDIYESMPVGKQQLIVPKMQSDKEFIEEWNNSTYVTLGFKADSPDYYSAKGIRMRSKSEVIIANLLDKYEIYYRYEKPLKLRKLGIVHPDFTLLDVKNRREIYFEHLGMMDDPTYRNNAIIKIRDYENSGYFLGDRLIVTFETLNCPLDVKSVERKIKFIFDKK